MTRRRPETGSVHRNPNDDDCEIIAANLYLGAQPIAQALDQGADIVVTGRVADSALALGPLMHAFGWKADDWDRLAAGTLAGHLLECGSQITGGYFADPPYKTVPGLAEVGYPIAEIDPDGSIVVGKPSGTGGRIDRQTVIEQILYEIHDPAAYLVPDVVLDLTDVEVEEIGADRVRVTGARGKPAPQTLKATVCIDAGMFGEAEISYAGPNAAARARLAAGIIGERMQKRAPGLLFRTDAIGVTSILGDSGGAFKKQWLTDPADIRLRFAAQSAERRRDRASARRGRSAVLRGAGGRGGGAAADDAAAGQRLMPRRTQIRFAARDHARSRVMSTRTVKLHEIANARSGDKGNRLNIALVCRDPAHYDAIAQHVTAERVKEVFAARKPSQVVRYDLPKLAAFNFVLDDVLEGGVNASLGLDGHGKSLSFLLLDMNVQIDAGVVAPPRSAANKN